MQNIGFGTAAIGRPQYINIRKKAASRFDLDTFKKEGVNMLNEAYERGIRYFDTAPGYGVAEALLIKWVCSKNDPDIEIATKWGYRYVANFDPLATIHEVKEHNLSLLNEQWRHSIALLPYLSTYQIHSATFETKILENTAVLGRLSELKHNHGIKIGLTTTGSNQVDVIQQAMDVTIDGTHLFDTYQVTYNIMDQSLSTVSDLLHSNDKRIIIKEALANGRMFPNLDYPNHQRLYSVLNRMVEKYQVGIDAIALRFCMDSIKPFVTLSGASTSTQLSQNLQTNTFTLDEEDLDMLRTFRVNPDHFWSERKRLAWN